MIFFSATVIKLTARNNEYKSSVGQQRIKKGPSKTVMFTVAMTFSFVQWPVSFQLNTSSSYNLAASPIPFASVLFSNNINE